MTSEAASAMPDIDNPLLELLGVELSDWQPNSCALTLRVGPSHLNRRGTLQGGVIATLLDVAAGYSGLLSADSPVPSAAATIMLTISYLSSVCEGEVRAIGQVTRSGRSVYFASAHLTTADGQLLATAQGSFKRARVAATSTTR